MYQFSKTLSAAAKAVFMLALVVFLASCKKDDTDDNNNTGGTKALIIENGGLNLASDQSATYSARVVSTDGSFTPATGVTWSVGESSVAVINASGVLTPKGVGITTVKATATVDGKTLTAEAPLAISAPSIFAVAPAAIIMGVGDEIPLTPVYINPTQGSVSYTYATSSASVASVTSAGVVRGAALGLCQITVTASLDGNPTFIVPVWVVGPPAVALPITEVKVTPVSKELFRNDQFQFSAKAYNGAGAEVSANFTWRSLDDNIATVSATGQVTGKNIGETKIQASANGVIGEAFVTVQPDTVVIVTPYWVSVGAGKTKQFTAKAYNARNGAELSVSNFVWEMPPSIPGFEQFNVGSVNGSGLVTVNSNAMAGIASVVIASVGGSETAAGAAMIQVALSVGDDCGPDNPNVASIGLTSPATVNISITGGNPTSQIQAVAQDALGENVSGAELKYSSDNAQAAAVDSFGMITGVGPGTATITICVGSVSKTVTVNVSF